LFSKETARLALVGSGDEVVVFVVPSAYLIVVVTEPSLLTLVVSLSISEELLLDELATLPDVELVDEPVVDDESKDDADDDASVADVLVKTVDADEILLIEVIVASLKFESPQSRMDGTMPPPRFQQPKPPRIRSLQD